MQEKVDGSRKSSLPFLEDYFSVFFFKKVYVPTVEYRHEVFLYRFYKTKKQYTKKVISVPSVIFHCNLHHSWTSFVACECSLLHSCLNTAQPTIRIHSHFLETNAILSARVTRVNSFCVEVDWNLSEELNFCVWSNTGGPDFRWQKCRPLENWRLSNVSTMINNISFVSTRGLL